jgi:hypothetical protein
VGVSGVVRISPCNSSWRLRGRRRNCVPMSSNPWNIPRNERSVQSMESDSNTFSLTAVVPNVANSSFVDGKINRVIQDGLQKCDQQWTNHTTNNNNCVYGTVYLVQILGVVVYSSIFFLTRKAGSRRYSVLEYSTGTLSPTPKGGDDIFFFSAINSLVADIRLEHPVRPSFSRSWCAMTPQT